MIPANAHCVVEINGKRYASIKEITDPTVARIMKTLVEELNRFFGTNLINSTPSAPPPAATPAVKVISLDEAKNLPLEKPSMDIFKQYRHNNPGYQSVSSFVAQTKIFNPLS